MGEGALPANHPAKIIPLKTYPRPPGTPRYSSRPRRTSKGVRQSLWRALRMGACRAPGSKLPWDCLPASMNPAWGDEVQLLLGEPGCTGGWRYSKRRAGKPVRARELKFLKAHRGRRTSPEELSNLERQRVGRPGLHHGTTLNKNARPTRPALHFACCTATSACAEPAACSHCLESSRRCRLTRRPPFALEFSRVADRAQVRESKSPSAQTEKCAPV